MNASEQVSPESAQVLLDDLRAYQQEQEQDPANHLPPYHCGLIHAQLGDYAAAVRSYYTAVERNPDFAQAYFNMAIAYSAQGLYGEAEEAYLQAGNYSTSDGEPWANLGALREFLGREDEALEAYRKAVVLNPDEREARRQIGLILFNRGQLDEAAEVFQEAVAHNPQNEEAWNNLGLIAFRREQFEEAQNHYQKAVEIDQDFAQAWNNLGNLYLKQGNEAGAVGAYRRALAGDSHDPNIWFNLGEFFFARDHPEAEKCIARVVELDRGDMEAWEMLRQWYTRHPQYAAWKSVLTVLQANSPDDLSLMREMSFVHEKMGEHAEAIRVLKEVIAKDPEDTETRLMMAGLALKQGKPLDAYEQMNLLESTEDDVLDMWQYLGQRLVYHDKWEEAETTFMKVIARRPWQLDAWQFLGELAFRREAWDVAFERYCRAEEMNRNDTAVWLPLANRFVEGGDFQKASACLDRLSDHLKYLVSDWERFFPIYQQAGRGADFLGLLEKLMWDSNLPNHLWMQLAAMFSQAGLAERAQACLGRLEGGLESRPGGEAMLEKILLGRLDGEVPEIALDDAELTMAVVAPAAPPPKLAPTEQSTLEAQLESHLRALKLDPSDFRAWFNAGNALFRLHRLDEAERHFRGAINLQPEEPKAWYNLGCSQEALGDMEAACESFEKAVELDGAFAQAWNWLGVLRYHLNRNDAARRAYIRSLAYDRTSGKAWHNLGVLYHRLNEREKSAYCFQESKKLGGVREG